VNLITFLFFEAYMIALIYPIITAWTWGGGWLNVMGYQDFAGAGIVHLTGGIAGLVGAIILGPRIGRFTGEGHDEAKSTERRDTKCGYEEAVEKYKSGEWDMQKVNGFVRRYNNKLDEEDFSPASLALVVLGTMVLWLGWILFNGGSSLSVTGGNLIQAEKAVVNSIISPAAAGVFSFILRNYVLNRGPNKKKYLDITTVTNGILAGAVSITACCN